MHLSKASGSGKLLLDYCRNCTVTAPKETKDEQRPALSTASSKHRLPYYPVFASKTDGDAVRRSTTRPL